MISNVMEYKGRLVSREFDAEDKIIVGRVLDIDDIIEFHGESVTQFEKAFHQT
jgi:predicted HicB family RNase H-like nuclease